MKILHVASFSGNVGDNLNHNGLRYKLSSILPENTTYDELEMRRFYLKYDGSDKLKFDHNFAKLANKYDLVIIGGGNFFEIWLENSSTGCTIDMPESTIDAIKTKVLFFGLGFDRYKGYSNSTESKFLSFIKNLNKRPNFYVTVRNDGSMDQFVDTYGPDHSHLIKKVPDGGFFAQIDDDNNYLHSDKINVILSLAMDMADVRFGKNNSDFLLNTFVKNIADYIKKMIKFNNSICIALIPHIYSDLKIINSVIDLIPDFIRRNNIFVGPYVTGKKGEQKIFSLYKKACLIAGMRFHANVCGIGMNIPTIGINSYKKIFDLYRELGVNDRIVESTDLDLSDILFKKSCDLIINPDNAKYENLSILKDLNSNFDNFLSVFKIFLCNGK